MDYLLQKKSKLANARASDHPRTSDIRREFLKSLTADEKNYLLQTAINVIRLRRHTLSRMYVKKANMLTFCY